MNIPAVTALAQELARGTVLRGDDAATVTEDVFGVEVLGLVYDEIAFDHLTAHVDIDRRHLQPMGVVHGGVWASIVESLASLGATLEAALRGGVAVGITNTTDFLRPQGPGRVWAQAEPADDHAAASLPVWTVRITNADEKLIAYGSLRLQILDSPLTATGRADATETP